ncbi:MAG: magnesium transporter [Thermoleophilaceae bacterium]|nr:magnesium transporter [Thermoleophilaceae bacterium]
MGRAVAVTPEEAADSSALLEVAVEHASAHVPTTGPRQRAAAARAALLHGGPYEFAGDVAVLEDGRLVGLVAIERLLTAGDDEVIADMMDPQPPVVAPGVDQERVAWEMVQRGESSVGVVDAGERFIGLVAPYRMLDVVLREHDEDLARLGGYMSATRGARTAAEEPVRRRLLHRVPWLLVGLAGAMASTLIVGAYETELDRVVLLAFFLPAVVYMADAVGTQTETVLIRGSPSASTCGAWPVASSPAGWS